LVFILFTKKRTKNVRKKALHSKKSFCPSGGWWFFDWAGKLFGEISLKNICFIKKVKSNQLLRKGKLTIGSVYS
jgi:hypothetical protein